MSQKPINVLQFICPVGFYGAERWILALVNNAESTQVRHDLAVTQESDNQDLEIISQFPVGLVHTHKIKMKSRFDWAAVNQIADIIRNRNIQIIHTHGYKSDILGLLAAKKTGIKCVSTPHGFGQPSSVKLQMFIRLGTLSLRWFDKVVPLSRQLYDEVLALGVPRQKVAYIQNGVDLSEVEAYRLKKRQKTDDETKVIGFIGQMIPRKNIKDILDIFDTVSKTIPNIKLQLLGDGESRDEMEALASTLPSRDRIEFLGFRHDRMDYLMNFDLFVMTSKDEGIPRCLMEAMGMQVPVAAYGIKGIDQLIEHDKTGLLAAFGDTDTLTSHWVKLLSDRQTASTLARQAFEFVNKRFSGKRMSTEYTQLFNSLTGKDR